MADLYGNIPISDEPDQPEHPRKAPPPKPKPRRPPQQSKSLLKRWYILTPLIVLLLAAGYYIASSALIPVFIEKKFPQIFHKNTGLTLNIASSRFNPLNCSVVASDIDIESPTENETTDVLTIGDLYLDLDLISLLRHGIVSESLVISDAAFTLIRYPDKSYNISRFFGNDKGGDAVSDIMNFAELPFFYSLNNISISDSSLLFKDISSGQQHRVEKLNLSLPTLSNFSIDVGHYIQPRFSAVINGSLIELTGDTELPSAADEKTSTTMSFNLQDLDLSLYAGYLPMPLPVDIEKGRVSGNIELSFLSGSSAGRQLNFVYKLQIEEGIFHSHDRSLALTVPLLNIEGSLDPLKSDIAINNLLLRDPFLKVAHHFSAATVDSLFLGDYDPKQSAAVPLEPPSLRVGLLIADNGKIEVETEADNLVFAPVQLSMRNYAGGRYAATASDIGENSFRLSGESTNDFSLFSWQGRFEDGTPVGEVEINNLPLSLLLSQLQPKAETVTEGITDINGRLSLRRGANTALDYSLENGTIRLSQILLREDSRQWLQSSAGSLSPVHIDGDTVDLGNLFLENAAVNLQRMDLPAVVNSFLGDEHSSLQGIDIKGNLSLAAEYDSGLPLELEKVHLQISDLNEAKPKKENFALTADVASGGSVKAKGRLHISPLTGSIDIGFNTIAAAAILRQSEEVPLLFDEGLLLSGSGTIDIPNRRFKGSLETDGASISHRGSGYTCAFDKAALASIDTALDLRDYKAEKIMLKGLSLTGNSLRLTADGASVSSLNSSDEDFSAGEIIVANTEIFLLPGFSAESLPFLADGAGSIAVDKVAMNGKIYTVSASDDRKEIVPSFAAELAPLSNTLPRRSNLSLQLRLDDGGEIDADGSLAVAPLQAKLGLNLSRVDSDFFAPLAPENLKSSLEALINGQVSYYHPEKMVSGDIQLDGGRLYSDDGADLASWQSAILSDFKFTLSPMHLGITKLTVEAPRLSYTNTGSHPLLHIRRALESALPQDDQSSGSISFSRLNIARIDIQNGVVEYIDERMSPTWQADITSFSGFINNYHLSESVEPIDYGVRGTIDGGGLAAHGSLAFAEDDIIEESVLELEKMPLSGLEDQLLQSFALQVDSATADLHCTLGGGDDKDRAQLTLHSLAAADADSPLAMTIALLSDSPDSFSETIALKDAEKPVYNQIVNHFQKLVVKTTVSPYLLLPERYADLRRQSPLLFEAGETELSTTAAGTLDLYALLIEDYPRLRLTLHSIVDRSEDTAALKARLEQEEQERVQGQNKMLLRQWQEQSSMESPPAPAEGAIAEQEISEEDLRTFTPVTAAPVVITEEMLTSLGRQRMERAYAFLLDKHDIPEQNVLLDDQPQIIDNQAKPQIMIELGHY